MLDVNSVRSYVLDSSVWNNSVKSWYEEGNNALVGYYTCTTGSSTAAKTVNDASGYVLSLGGSMKIRFTNRNTASSPTLNINGQGAKTIVYDGSVCSSTNTWADGETVEVYYDGTNFQANNVAGGGNFSTGQKVRETGIDSEPVAGSNNLVKSGGTNKFVAEVNSIGKKELNLHIFYGYTTKNGYQLKSDGTIEAKTGITASKYRIVYTNTSVSKNSILVFTGTCNTDGKTFAIGISSVPITDENITNVQITILSHKTYPAGDISETIIVPFDGYIVYYRYTDYLTNIVSKIKNVSILPDNSVLDVSELNNTNYNSLSEAIAAIPDTLQKGGMEIRFIQFTPAVYNVIKTDGITEQPSGIEVQEALSLESGSYTASQMEGIVLPSSGSIIYYLEVIETIESIETITYTTWVITKDTDDTQEYVQYHLTNTEWSVSESYWNKVVNYNEINEDINDSILNTLDYKEIDISTLTQKDYYITTTSWGSNSNGKHRSINTIGGEKYYLKASKEHVAEYAFLISDNPASGRAVRFVDGTAKYSVKAGSTAIITIPKGCNFLYICDTKTSSGTPVPGYLPERLVQLGELFKSGEALYELSIDNEITNNTKNIPTSAAVLNEDDITRSYIAWKLYAQYRIYIGSGRYLSYTPCKKDELFKIECNDNSAYYGFCASKPTSEDDIDHITITQGSYIIKSQIDGYFCVSKSSIDNVYVYKADTLYLKELYTETIDVTNATIRNKALIVNDDSSNYNSLIDTDTNKYCANTEYIDISNYKAIGLVVTYSTASFLAQNRQNQDIPGAIFYDEEYMPIKSIPLMAKIGSNSKVDIVRIEVPDGAKYLKASYYYTRRFILGYSNIFKVIPTEDRIEDIISDNAKTTGSRTVFETNPDDEIKPKLDALCKSVRHNSVLSSKSVVFGHISDCHGSGTTGSRSENTWNRFIDFMNHWDTELDDIVDTGDIVSGKYTDGIAWRTNSEKVLTVIGNHDSYGEGSTQEGEVWRVHIADCYNTYIKNNIDNWNVVQPENAEELGKCYYYKDYAKSGYNESTSSQSTLTIRAIFLDCMGWGYGNDAEKLQAQWLEDTLDDARLNGYKVVIFCHFPPMRWRKIDCSYSSYAKGISVGTLPPWGTSNYNRYFEEVSQIVYKFQIAGGEFLGYVTGHYHYDCIGQVGGCWDFVNHTEGNIEDAYNGDTVTSFDVINFDNELYPQMVFSVGTGNVKLSDNIYDYKMSAGTKNNDNFQLIAFNAYANVARLAKIGCNIDVHMRKKDTIEVFTGQISTFDPNNVSYTEGTKVEKDGVIYRLIKPIVINNQTSWESSVKEISSRVNI